MSNMPGKIFAYEETFNGQNRKTGWVQSIPAPGICNPVEYIRADVANAEIERLKNALDQAVSHMTDGCGWPFTASDAIHAGEPELAAWLKEKENG